MRILVGFIWDGKSGGIDAYLMAFARVAAEEGVHLDFLTNEYCEELAAELEGMGHRLFEIATLRNRASQKRTIRSLCRSNAYDAAYFNISTALMYPVVKDARNEGVVNIAVHSHAAGNDQRSSMKKTAFDIANFVLRRRLRAIATHKFACSKVAAMWLFGEERRLAECALLIPNPVDVRSCEYNPSVRKAIRENMGLTQKTVIGSVTAMKEVKNPFLLVDVFSEYRKKDASAHLLVVGGGELSDDVLRYAESVLESGSYSFLGKRTDVYDLLQLFDVFVLTSKSEGLSIATVEAQIAGLPCLLSDGVPDEAVINERLVGKMSKKSSIAEWANTLEDLVELSRSLERRSFSEEAIDAGFCEDSLKMVLNKLGSAEPNEERGA